MKISSLSFKTKLIGTVTISVIVCGLISIFGALYFCDREMRTGLIEKSRIIHGRLDVAAKYVAEQGGLQPMIEKFTAQYSDPSLLTDEDRQVILQQVPIYAAMKIGSEGAHNDHYNFRVFSNEPRNKKNVATAEEMAIFEKFEKDPKLEEIVENESDFVTVYRPVRLTASHGCFTCHGNPSTSPWKNGKDILGYQMENWKEGKLHGVFAVSNDIEVIAKAEAQRGGASPEVLLSLIILGSGLLIPILTYVVINGPINVLSRIANALSQSGQNVNEASDNIAGSSEALSQASTEQAASLEETAASLEEISSMIEK
ncbi:DUF3365 domain-containing protein, partial [bacterium]|nr:DUF3365 domain-containing protein [bacterium]